MHLAADPLPCERQFVMFMYVNCCVNQGLYFQQGNLCSWIYSNILSSPRYRSLLAIPTRAETTTTVASDLMFHITHPNPTQSLWFCSSTILRVIRFLERDAMISIFCHWILQRTQHSVRFLVRKLSLMIADGSKIFRSARANAITKRTETRRRATASARRNVHMAKKTIPLQKMWSSLKAVLLSWALMRNCKENILRGLGCPRKCTDRLCPFDGGGAASISRLFGINCPDEMTGCTAL